MADIQRGELQDNLGNVIYPHSEADLIFHADGETSQKYSYVDAQSDGFFPTNTDSSGEYRFEGNVFPSVPGQYIYADQPAPVGSGLLLLAGMGAAYALRKRRK